MSLVQQLAAAPDATGRKALIAQALATDPAGALNAWWSFKRGPDNSVTPGCVFYAPATAPRGCPWALSGDAAVDLASVLGAWQPLMKSFFKEFQKLCVAVVPVEVRGRWHLCYVVRRGKGRDLELAWWFGGPPSTATHVAARGPYSSPEPIPVRLPPLYAVHDGFGPFGSADKPFDHFALWPVSELKCVEHETGMIQGVIANTLYPFMSNSVGARHCAQDSGRTRAILIDRAAREASLDKDVHAVVNTVWLETLRGEWAMTDLD